jgi:DNA-binding CsgD family transcriptional regulator
MQYAQQQWSRTQVEALMGISAALADYTSSLELTEQLPHYLSRELDLESLTLAIVRDVPAEGEPRLFLRSSSGMVATGEAAATFPQQILAIYQQTRPLTQADGPTLRRPFDDHEAVPAEMAVQRLGLFPRATVLARTLDDQHRMLLVVHHRAEDPHLTDGLTDMLQLVADQTAKFLSCLVAWHTRPADVGEPLSRLTEREWMVLRGLNSEAGEKQLADQLHLSPHTLHSHIKSIYRKVGVQGRLPLLAKVKEATLALRTKRCKVISKGAAPASPVSAVAVG